MYDQRFRLALCPAVGSISIFLPWITVGKDEYKETLSGLLFPHQYGIICLGIFVVLFILALVGNRKLKVINPVLYSIVALAVVSLGISVYSLYQVETHAFRNIYSLSERLSQFGKVATGIYLSLGASALLIFFALVDFDTTKS